MKYLLLLVSSFVFSQATEWKTLEDSELMIKYPGNWEINQSGIAGTKFILFSPHSQSPAFRDNINLIIQDLKGQNIDLKKYVEISTDQIKQLITNGKILSSETTTANPKHKIIYTGSQGQLNLKWQQYYWVKNEKAYVLTFTADQNSFDKQMESVNQIMDSFKIK